MWPCWPSAPFPISHVDLLYPLSMYSTEHPGMLAFMKSALYNWWMISFGRENTSLLKSSKPQLLFIPVSADGHFLLSRMPIFDTVFTTGNSTHIGFLIMISSPALNYLICGLFFPWYQASMPDNNLDYVTCVTGHANSRLDLWSLVANKFWMTILIF